MQGGIQILAALLGRVLGGILRKIWWVLLLSLACFVGGVYVARTWWPRVVVQTVSKEVLREVPKPGQTRVVHRPVYVTRGRTVRVPVTVIRYVPSPSPPTPSSPSPSTTTATPPRERIVTVTEPVEVPVEVVKEVWPSTITVRIQSVDTEEYGWATPKNKDLVIGMVEPGIYALPKQEGWSVEKVTAETVLPPVQVHVPEKHSSLFLYVGVQGNTSTGNVTIEAGAAYRNVAFGGTYEVRAAYTFPGVSVGVYWGKQF